MIEEPLSKVIEKEKLNESQILKRMHEPLWEAIEKNDLEAASVYLSQNERYSEE